MDCLSRPSLATRATPGVRRAASFCAGALVSGTYAAGCPYLGVLPPPEAQNTKLRSGWAHARDQLQDKGGWDGRRRPAPASDCRQGEEKTGKRVTAGGVDSCEAGRSADPWLAQARADGPRLPLRAGRESRFVRGLRRLLAHKILSVVVGLKRRAGSQLRQLIPGVAGARSEHVFPEESADFLAANVSESSRVLDSQAPGERVMDLGCEQLPHHIVVVIHRGRDQVNLGSVIGLGAVLGPAQSLIFFY